MVHFHSKQLCVAEVTHSSTLAMRWIWAISICCSRSMGEAIGYYNSITTHRYHKETIRHSFTAHYIISLRCTLCEFYIPKSTGIAPTQAMYYRETKKNSRREDAKMEKQVNPPIRQIPVRSGFAGSRKAPQSVVTLRNRAATIATISAHLGFRIR